MNNLPQVNKSHYNFSKYAFEGRFVSYYWQLKEVLSHNPSSILEVGVGDQIFGSFIKNNTDIAYTSVDVAEDLHPDIVGNIMDLPLAKETYDTVCAFEVLEHLPFERFDDSVGELCRIAKKYVVISIPHFGPMFSFSLKIPFLPLLHFAIKMPFHAEHHFNGEYFWEVGKRGYPVSIIRNKLTRHGKIIRDFIPSGSPYHHFFVLEKIIK